MRGLIQNKKPRSISQAGFSFQSLNFHKFLFKNVLVKTEYRHQNHQRLVPVDFEALVVGAAEVPVVVDAPEAYLVLVDAAAPVVEDYAEALAVVEQVQYVHHRSFALAVAAVVIVVEPTEERVVAGAAVALAEQVANNLDCPAPFHLAVHFVPCLDLAYLGQTALAVWVVVAVGRSYPRNLGLAYCGYQAFAFR